MASLVEKIEQHFPELDRLDQQEYDLDSEYCDLSGCSEDQERHRVRRVELRQQQVSVVQKQLDYVVHLSPSRKKFLANITGITVEGLVAFYQHKLSCTTEKHSQLSEN